MTDPAVEARTTLLGSATLGVCSETSSLKVTVKWIVAALAGSPCPGVSSTVTVGATVSRVTELSCEVEAALGTPVASMAAPAGMEAMTVPSPSIPLTSTR